MKKKSLFILFIILFIVMCLSSSSYAVIVDEGITDSSGTFYAFDLDIRKNYNYYCFLDYLGDCFIVFSNSTLVVDGQDLVASDGSSYLCCSWVTYYGGGYTPVTNDETKFNSVTSFSLGDIDLSYQSNSYYGNFDLKTVDGETVFQQPPQKEKTLSQIVEVVETEKTLAEVVGILPMILMIIVGLIGLRKALTMLSRLLRRS